MAIIKKAGVAFDVFVDTAKDVLGKPSGFSGKIIANSDGTEIALSSVFTEVIETVTAASTTTSAAADATRTLPVSSVSGFELGDTISVSGNYYVITSIDSKAVTFGLNKDLEGAVAASAKVEKVGNTGTYKASATITNVGDYLVVVSNYELGMGNTTYPLTIESANIDDVKTVLDTVQTDVTNIQSKVNTLSTTALDSISTQINSVDGVVTNIKGMLDGSQDVILTLNGDETAKLVAGDTVTGDTSKASGVVSVSSYDSTTKITTVTVNNATGKFAKGETLNNGSASTTGTVQSIINDAINDVLTFVKDINSALTTGGSSLAALQSLNDNIEYMLQGTAKLADGSANPLAGMGLNGIMTAIAAVKGDTAAIRTLAEDSAYGFAAIRTAIDNGRNSIESEIAALTDTSVKTSLISKISAAQTAIAANATTLGDSTYGLSAIKTELDTLSAVFASGGSIETQLTSLESYTQNLSSAISAQTTHIDGKFADVMSGLNKLGAKTTYSVFA